MKVCTVCKTDKDMSEYGKQRTGKNGLRASCKTCEKAYKQARYNGDLREKLLARAAETTREWRKANPEKALETKRRYYASDKGKRQKAKEEAKYKASGKRAETEKRRTLRPLSEARKLARAMHSIKKRSSEKTLSPLSMFVLAEARELRKTREITTGVAWHIDHIVPVSKGGSSEYYNIQVVPAKWNRQKSNKHQERYMNIA